VFKKLRNPGIILVAIAVPSNIDLSYISRVVRI
jgi:hypothetical protein